MNEFEKNEFQKAKELVKKAKDFKVEILQSGVMKVVTHKYEYCIKKIHLNF